MAAAAVSARCEVDPRMMCGQRRRRGRRRGSPTAVDLDRLGARLALDVTAPVVLAVAVVSHDHALRRETAPATHRLAAVRTRRVFFAHPAHTYRMTLHAITGKADR